MHTQTEFFVIQHDQGASEDVDSWSTKREAMMRIVEIETDMEIHPSWYRHLANPCWTIEKRLVAYDEPFLTSWAEWENA